MGIFKLDGLHYLYITPKPTISTPSDYDLSG